MNAIWCNPSQMGVRDVVFIYSFIDCYFFSRVTVTYEYYWALTLELDSFVFAHRWRGRARCGIYLMLVISVCCTDSRIYVRSAVTHRLGDDPSCDMEAPHGGPHGQYL